jgi:hypothetical protein
VGNLSHLWEICYRLLCLMYSDDAHFPMSQLCLIPIPSLWCANQFLATCRCWRCDRRQSRQRDGQWRCRRWHRRHKRSIGRSKLGAGCLVVRNAELLTLIRRKVVKHTCASVSNEIPVINVPHTDYVVFTARQCEFAVRRERRTIDRTRRPAQDTDRPTIIHIPHPRCPVITGRER